jgi:hypothetical protein
MIPPTPTWAPLPTLPPDEANALLLDLVETNGGCQFPCWWGITPGETDWLTAAQFLSTFSRRVIQVEADFENGILRYAFLTGFREQGKAERLTAAIISRNGIVDEIRLYGNIYSLSQILNYQVVPSRIDFLFPDEGYRDLFSDDISSVSMSINFPAQGIDIIFQDFEVTGEGRIVEACFDGATTYWIIRPLASYQPTGFSGGFERPLERLSVMDIETFVETFSDPTTEPCMEISLENYW